MIALPTNSELLDLLPYLTPQERAEMDRLLMAKADNDPLESARHSLLGFTLYTKPDYKVNWHHGVVCEYLDRFVAGEIKRLMLFMPPRHGKSELVSRRLPAYILGRNPEASLIATSYSADLASRMNRDVQRIIDAREYIDLFPGTKLHGSNIRTVSQGTYLRNSDIFEVVGHRGVYRSAGVGGGITGMGFDYGIIDDPLKNRKEANSETIRRAVWEWYTSTFYTRQEGDAGILVTMTRWHMDDLAGRLLLQMREPETDEDAEFADQWTVVSFPARAHPISEKHPQTEHDRREVGEPLWETKYNHVKLLRIENTIGTFDWSSLYQQNPVPAEGGIFKRKWFEPQIDDMPPMAYAVRFWDLAMSDKTSADYTVGTLYGMGVDGHRYVLDVARKQIDWGDLTEWLANVMLADGPNVAQGIEEKGYMSRAVQALNADARLRGYSIFGYPKDKDKLTNALPFAAKAGAGLVHVLNRHWTQNWIEEICSFPNGANDDQLDSIAGADTMLDSGAFDGMGSMVMSNHGAISQSEY